jgi:hypothetical protein
MYPEGQDVLLTQIQTRTSGSRRNRPSLFVGVALVCLVLLALLSVAQVAHTHQGGSDADHCPLCIVMHTAAPVAATAALVALVRVARALPIPEVDVVTRHWHPQLFTRPPPMGR